MNTDLAPHADFGAFAPTVLLPASAQRATQRDLERTAAQTFVARTREHCRGLLADEALGITGALSTLESHLIQIAPLGEARYKAIVDSYALASAAAVRRL